MDGGDERFGQHGLVNLGRPDWNPRGEPWRAKRVIIQGYDRLFMCRGGSTLATKLCITVMRFHDNLHLMHLSESGRFCCTIIAVEVSV